MKGKDKAKSSRSQPVEYRSSFEDDSEENYPKRKEKSLMKSKGKIYSKVSSVSKALLKNLFRSKEKGERSKYGSDLYGEYMRAFPFTSDILEEVFPLNFKLPTIPFYNGKGVSKTMSTSSCQYFDYMGSWRK